MLPEKWLVLEVVVPSSADRAVLAEGLIALGGGAVEERDDRLITYLVPPVDVEAFVVEAEARLRETAPAESFRLEWRWRENEDWTATWRRGLKPRRIGRLVVTPSWESPELGDGDLVVVIDPEMAFGTGEHASTRGVLRLLQQAYRGGDRVLDVGAGSAILSIAAARLGAAEVLAVEADEDAIGNARDNIERNGVADVVELVHALVDDDYLARQGDGRFDLILANVLSGVLVPLLPAFRRALAPSGRLILAGILQEESERVAAAAERAGFTLLAEDREEEWWSALFEVGARQGAASR